MKIFTVPDVVSNGYITLATVGLGTQVNASLLSGAYVGNCVRESLLEEAEMIVLASPIYYHSFTGQLQCAINRIYALDKPKNLKKAALILSSGSNHMYGGTIYEYEHSFLSPFPDEGAGKLPK